MEICPDEKALRHYMTNAVDISELDNAPVLIDKFLDDATEVVVDVVADFDPRHGATERRSDEATKGKMSRFFPFVATSLRRFVALPLPPSPPQT
jgi:hypothetical protein